MIPQKHMMKLYKQSYAWSLGRAPTHSNLPKENALTQPAADFNYEWRATAVPLALPVWCWEGLRRPTGKLQMLLTHSYSRNWARLSLYSDLFAAGASVRAEPLEVWAESLHAVNHSCPPWSYSMHTVRNTPVSTPMMYPCNIDYSIL